MDCGNRQSLYNQTAITDKYPNQNHGNWVNVPWENGLVNFTSAFQWGEIPSHPAYHGAAFSMGGWLFNRRPAYQRDGMLFMGVGNPIQLLWDPQNRSKKESPVVVRVRPDLEAEVVTSGKDAALGSLAGAKGIGTHAWRHVFYTYENGTSRLYLNGKLIQARTGVNNHMRQAPLLIGSCAGWWMLHPPGSNSLDGTVRDLVLFNRALPPAEVAQLATAMPRPVRVWPGPKWLLSTTGNIPCRSSPRSKAMSLAVFFPNWPGAGPTRWRAGRLMCCFQP